MSQNQNKGSTCSRMDSKRRILVHEALSIHTGKKTNNPLLPALDSMVAQRAGNRGFYCGRCGHQHVSMSWQKRASSAIWFDTIPKGRFTTKRLQASLRCARHLQTPSWTRGRSKVHLIHCSRALFRKASLHANPWDCQSKGPSSEVRRK